MNSMTSSHASMPMVFTDSHNTPLYSARWTPDSPGAYAATCIFLVVLASILRGLFALKSVIEQKWVSRARNRRYVVVKGKTTEAGRIDVDPDAKNASLITSQGVEEPVRVVRAYDRGTVPFRLSVDVPRAAIVVVLVGLSYLLMLAVMTLNVGYFLSILAGTFLGEVLVGRYSHWEEHDH